MFDRITRAMRAALVRTAGGLSIVAALASPAAAYDVHSTADVNVDANDVILRGYDATTYMSRAGGPRTGDPDFTRILDGAIYRFASADARDRFAADPSRFMPEFGGFCATGAALGKKLDGDPEIFRVQGGRLYVFVSQAAAEAWDADPEGMLARATAAWPGIRDRAPASL